jgi:hypothetical protein
VAARLNVPTIKWLRKDYPVDRQRRAGRSMAPLIQYVAATGVPETRHWKELHSALQAKGLRALSPGQAGTPAPPWVNE